MVTGLKTGFADSYNFINSSAIAWSVRALFSAIPLKKAFLVSASVILLYIVSISLRGKDISGVGGPIIELKKERKTLDDYPHIKEDGTIVGASFKSLEKAAM